MLICSAALCWRLLHRRSAVWLAAGGEQAAGLARTGKGAGETQAVLHGERWPAGRFVALATGHAFAAIRDASRKKIKPPMLHML